MQKCHNRAPTDLTGGEPSAIATTAHQRPVRDMEFKIKAWAFTAEVENGDDLVDFDLADFDPVDLANRQLG